MIQLLKLEISKPNFQLFSIARTEECQQDGRIGSPLLVSLLRNSNSAAIHGQKCLFGSFGTRVGYC